MQQQEGSREIEDRTTGERETGERGMRCDSRAVILVITTLIHQTLRERQPAINTVIRVMT